VVGLLREEALPVWHEMAAVPGMGPHAKFALFTMEAGPEPDEGQWLWLAVEPAAVALAGKGPDEAVTMLWEALSAEKLAADDLEHRLAVARVTGHPSALSLAAAIADFAASVGAGKAQREPVPATEGLARALEAADLADGADSGHREPRRAAPRDPGPVRLGRRPPARLPGPPPRTPTRRSNSRRPVMSTSCGC
jgi:hypothetical protein